MKSRPTRPGLAPRSAAGVVAQVLSARLSRDQAGSAHETTHSVTMHTHASASQAGGDTPITVGAVRSLELGPD